MFHKIRFSVALISLLFIASPVYAQAPSAKTAPTPTAAVNAETIATVNIWKASVRSQVDNEITIAFDINNGVGVQPQVIYAITLSQKGADGRYIPIDTKVYGQDVLSLGEGETVHREVVYTAPAFLSGTYVVGIDSRNSNGLSFAFVNLTTQPVTLQGTGGHIAVDPDTCFLTVDGETSDKKYSLRQGVDVAANENLTAHCTLRNDFKTVQKITPVFETHYRTIFGKIVASDKLDVLTLAPGATLKYATSIPKVKDPQAYDAVLSFLNTNNDSVSLPVTFHYVLRGASATIQNVNLDKDYYAGGSSAKVSFFWSGSADAFRLKAVRQVFFSQLLTAKAPPVPGQSQSLFLNMLPDTSVA